MEKLDLQTPNFTDENIQKLSELFPNCVTEDADGKAIDFDQLRQELSNNIIEGNQECYQLTWPGKAKSIVTANTPINKTLRPNRKESKDFDNTENLYIEGDNLEVLKLLQETYLGKIKMIYIDPPYNTGKDFVYKDNFTQDKAEYDEESGNVDEDGGRLVSNPDSNGRYHSDWLSMMYPRLKLARNLLKDNGVIFISIDDNEAHNLRKICDEIFGEGGFVSELIWHLSSGPQAGHFTRSHESILVFAKSKESVPFFKDTSGGFISHGALKKISPVNPASEIIFPKGSIRCETEDIVFKDELGNSEKQYVTNGVLKFYKGYLANDVTIKAGWGMRNQVIQWLKGEDTFDSKGQRVTRFYFNASGILFYEKERGTFHPKTVIPSSEVGTTRTGGDEVFELFSGKVMSFPKPTGLIKFLSKLACYDDDTVLDFFSGSATTAHAVMQLNAEDGGNRKFIMAQIPETTDEKSEAHKAGYETIAEIGKERIRRAGEKITEDNADKEGIDDLDIGFRVLKVDSSNMKDTYYNPDNTQQSSLLDLASNIKDSRTEEDLLFQVLLDWGVDLTLKIERKDIAGKSVYFVDDDTLAACFEENINEDFVKELAKTQPLRVVFKDSSFASDDVKINIEQIFKHTSVHTDIKVI